MKFPKKEEETEIVFRITPKSVGVHKLNIIFYYRRQLLQVLSTSLKVNPDSLKQNLDEFTIRLKEGNILPMDILVSDEVGLESILEVQKSYHNDSL
jgi:hypothetical protein